MVQTHGGLSVLQQHTPAGVVCKFRGFIFVFVSVTWFLVRHMLPSDSLCSFSQSEIGEEGVFGGWDAGRRSLRSGRVECEIQVVLGV